MTASPIATTPAYLQSYRQALEALRTACSDEGAECLLALLLARDAVQEQLSDRRKDAASTVLQITELDAELYDLVSKSPHRQRLQDWRKTVAPGPEAWWWYLDQESSHIQWGNRNWVWDGLAIVFFALGLALSAEIARRFLSGGPDQLSWVYIAIQAVIALLAIGGALTKTGQALLARLFRGLPAYRWAQVRLAIALLFVGAALAFCATLPRIAQDFHNLGSDKYALGELLTAQQYFERAILLQPEYYEAHYYLGILHEDLLDYDAALAEYQYAAKGGLDTAYNNAARLLILMDKPAEAVTLLEGQSAEDEDTQLQMWKNLAWAWVELEAYANARSRLRDILARQPEHAAANCLMAITLEGLGRAEEGATARANCIRLTGSAFPEEVRWRLLVQEMPRAEE
jgi:tetratricopeptide (TPR) repeat protein